MLNPANRKRNQKYVEREFNIPVKVYEAQRTDVMRKTVQLHSPAKYWALVYSPSMKDRELLGTRFTTTSLTIIVKQNDAAVPTNDQIVEINDSRFAGGYFEIDEVLPDMRSRDLKMLVHRHAYATNQFEVLDDGR